MTEGVRIVLSPLLMTNYVLGLRIIEFPADQPRPWFSLVYISSLWSVYYFLLIYMIMPYISDYSLMYHICLQSNVIAILLSITFEAYQNQKLRDCLKKFAMFDDTLEMLGATTDYHYLRTRVLWIVSTWFITCVLMTYGEYLWFKDEYALDSATIVFINFILNYDFYINLIGDLTVTSFLGYVLLKFDQIEEWFRQSLENDTRVTRGLREGNPAFRFNHGQRESSKLSNARITWIIMHLHSGLCEISHEINTVFEMQMTSKMGCYFCSVALGLQEIFNTLLVKNYVNRGTLYFVKTVLWSSMYVFRLLLINCMCEKVSAKASAMGNFINKMLPSVHDEEINKNMSHLLLKITKMPLRFYGYGLFQYGFKFLHKLAKNVATILILIIQLHMKN
ncbi:Gr19 [Eciton burchellii]|nr:Gr19 [Eciton burchellii]